MCFKNLPIEFDSKGRPHLRADALRPYEVQPRALPEPVGSDGERREVQIDPVTRIAGALAFRAVIDLPSRRVVEAHAEATMFRGYEVILRGRQPLDAIEISSRACGVCGGVHATCASLALEMTAGVAPPPLAIVARNLGEAAELLYDHCLHLFLLAGPDYSEMVVRKTTPGLWSRAERSPAPRAAAFGLPTIADVMAGLNPLRGALYLEALDVTRDAREIATLVFGKYPHPSTIFPGGLGIDPSPTVFNQILGRIVRLFDYTKKVVAIWDDLADFFLEANPAFASVGARATNLLSVGLWDDPEVYDAAYVSADAWGARRLVSPGVVVAGELRSTRLTQINLGIEEFVEHAFYEQWAGDRFGHDPLGGPLSSYHPWNKETRPAPGARSWKEKYSWATAPRWDREALEAGPLARQWVTALAGGLQSEFVQVTDAGLEILVPKGERPEALLTWRVPPRPNALERNRARAYHTAYCVAVAYLFLLRAFQYLGRGDRSVHRPIRLPEAGLGVGFWEAGRGALTHHVVLEGGRLANYQIVTPSTWMASPRDPWGNPGPYEEAVLNTPILEEFRSPEEFEGIDILRTIRSFDPCMPCAVHLYTGDGRSLQRDATTCLC